MSNRRAFFESVYRDNLWNSEESRSGQGSEVRATASLAAELPAVLRHYRVQSILDVPCGDFHWMRHVDLAGIRYIGGDIVPDLIDANQRRYGNAAREFIQIDAIDDPLPEVDAIFCRDCAIHFSFELIWRLVANFAASRARYVFLTHDNCFQRYVDNGHANVDLEDATDGVNYLYRPLNFLLPPFAFPPPVHVINEGQWDQMKTMAMWRVDDLRQVLARR
ncbi:hypothetical protein WS62_03590 [Burkholderia sp. ABCPW 14]|uniref:class I SAM-dependent methyltransferase n=1 Tax=Burkholderia sp. ABCPW 14 TaxID=1637860 RepID=UPI000770BC3B|nr:class I SAM-dependent methyltransferase [Burkholderia sp. ABCPW 14]KVD75822.1 hypothetical protein WS62_03590 [Burkholderia sp. ABCPW 14]